MALHNLLSSLPSNLPDELIETILQTSHLRVERIVSCGHASPPGFWYDQEQGEFVVLLAGSARLVFENESIDLVPGAYVDIPAHKRHRVEFTDAEQTTVWLAIHYANT